MMWPQWLAAALLAAQLVTASDVLFIAAALRGPQNLPCGIEPAKWRCDSASKMFGVANYFGCNAYKSDIVFGARRLVLARTSSLTNKYLLNTPQINLLCDSNNKIGARAKTNKLSDNDT